MAETTIIGIDLAKRAFQLHGASTSGSVCFRKKLSRSQVLPFLARQPACIVAMEACGSAHHWGREISKLGHEVKLIPPVYVKPYVKRQKNDMSDAEAIAEAASRPTMRFVAIKSAKQQAQAMLFRTRELLVGQRTQVINALRGHLAEHGVVEAVGLVNVKRLEDALKDPDIELLNEVRSLADLYLDQIAQLSQRIDALTKQQRKTASEEKASVRLQTMPGVGPITALAIDAFAPPMAEFQSGRDFAAWLGLVPKQYSTGGKQILGGTSKMGQRDIRRLLIIGAMGRVRWALAKGTPEGSWLGLMLKRKPRMVVAIALANKMARAIWAMLTKEEDYREPLAAS